MGKQLFWSRDRLVIQQFDCLGLGLGFWLGLWIASRFWLGLGLGLLLGFLTFVKPAVRLKNCKNPRRAIIFGQAN